MMSDLNIQMFSCLALPLHNVFQFGAESEFPLKNTQKENW